MKRSLKFILYSLPILSLSISCKENKVEPKCEITYQSPLNIPDFGFAKMKFTVENTGDDSKAYDIQVYVKLKSGNHIVDKGSAYFGSLKPGESISDEAWLTSIEESDSYNNKEVTLYWDDAEGNTYKKSY